MPKLRALYDEAVKKLVGAGITGREASVDAGLLLQFVFGYDRSFLYAHGDTDIADGEGLSRFYELIGKRVSRIPLQHLTGEQSFMGLDFYVDENVLIPRPDTELLVEEALIEVFDGMRVLDLCTGSGCILISLMKYKNDIEGVASDISEAALSVCKKNAKRHGTYEKIDFIQSDIFDGIPLGEGFDAILSNPPYIRRAELESLQPEVRLYDPHIALDGHEDGLYFYRKIAKEAGRYLKLSGLLLLEIGYDQAKAVTELLKEAGFTDIEVKKDYAENDRVIKARKPLRRI